MKAFIAALIAIVIISAAGAIGLDRFGTTSAEAGAGSAVRLD